MVVHTQKFTLVMTRDISLVMTEAWYQGHLGAWRSYGFKLSDLIYIYDGTAVKSYRPVGIFENELPLYFGKWLKDGSHKQFLLQTFDTYLRDYKDMKYVKKNLSPKVSVEMAFEKIKSTQKLTIDGLRGPLPIFWLPVWKETMTKKFPQELMGRAVHIRKIQRDAFFDDATDIIDFYLKVISKKKRWPYELLRQMRLSELQVLLFKGERPGLNKLTQRRNGWAYLDKTLFSMSSFSKVLSGRQYKIVEGKISFIGILKGVPAQRGKAKGLVNIIRARRELGKFKKGEILISAMTTPWYLPLMKRASAIITDEGGLTSHAAIMARELRIPCIVGTKIATRVFKDGDLVEVDADKGIVRKI